MPRRLAGVFAHPDDDTFSMGGSVALLSRDLELTLVIATRGEAGMIADPSLAAAGMLGDVREREERAALDRLGVSGADVRYLGYEDGGLAKIPVNEVVERVVEVLGARGPQAVVTFGPDGVTRHADHVAIHQAATEAFHRLRSEEGFRSEGGAFARLFYVAIRAGDLERFRQLLRERGVDPGDPEAPFAPRGVPDHTVTACVDCRGVFDLKLAALREHATQRGELTALPEDLVPELLATECFVQAWPPVTDPAGVVLSDLFEGL